MKKILFSFIIATSAVFLPTHLVVLAAGLDQPCTDTTNSSDCDGEAVCDAGSHTCVAPNSSNSDYVAPGSQNTTDTGAAVPATSAGGGLTNPLKAHDLQTLLGQLLDFAINLGAIVLTLMLVYVGFQFVVAQGNEERLTKARTALMWTIIGGLILLGAKAIELVVQATVSSLSS